MHIGDGLAPSKFFEDGLQGGVSEIHAVGIRREQPVSFPHGRPRHACSLRQEAADLCHTLAAEFPWDEPRAAKLRSLVTAAAKGRGCG